MLLGSGAINPGLFSPDANNVDKKFFIGIGKYPDDEKTTVPPI
jgi:hypothetical protein